MYWKMLCRSRFWRESVQWHGQTGTFDFGGDNRSVAFYLSGLAAGDADFYVMINAHWEGWEFRIMEKGPWKRIINTFLAPPQDLLVGTEDRVHQDTYFVRSRSVVLLLKDA